MLGCLLTKFPKKIKGEEKKEGIKILQLDRKSYYGSESASLNLTNLWKFFNKGDQNNMEKKETRMLSLVKLLLKANVSKCLKWKAVDGTFVYQYHKGGLFSSAKRVISKIPNTTFEALKSDLMELL